MIRSDVVHQLNAIAPEGWEYHKLSLETGDQRNGRGNWETDLAALIFQGQSGSIRPDDPTRQDYTLFSADRASGF
jgi:hypothetical protein